MNACYSTIFMVVFIQSPYTYVWCLVGQYIPPLTKVNRDLNMTDQYIIHRILSTSWTIINMNNHGIKNITGQPILEHQRLQLHILSCTNQQALHMDDILCIDGIHQDARQLRLTWTTVLLTDIPVQWRREYNHYGYLFLCMLYLSSN